MNQKHPILLFLLLGYIVFPAAFQWVTNPEGSWLNPFFVWVLVIVGAFFLQKRKPDNDA